MTDKRALVLLGLAGLGITLAVLAKPAEAAPPPPPPPKYNYFCIFGDGFTAMTWEEMLNHYRTAHPDQPIVDLELQWV